MLIISKDNDYYDIGLSLGIDKSIVYKRKKEKIESILAIKKTFQKIIDSYNVSKNRVSTYSSREDYYFFVIGFCGNFYTGISFLHEKNPTFIYNEHDLDKNLNSFLEKSLTTSYLNDKNKKEFRNKFNNWLNVKIPYDDSLFFEHNTPILFFRKNKFGQTLAAKNINLKKYSFQKIKDPFSAFQEIMSFLSGVLGNSEKDIITIEDKYIKESKGFDKWSFKTPPTSKK